MKSAFNNATAMTGNSSDPSTDTTLLGTALNSTLNEPVNGVLNEPANIPSSGLANVVSNGLANGVSNEPVNGASNGASNNMVLDSTMNSLHPPVLNIVPPTDGNRTKPGPAAGKKIRRQKSVKFSKGGAGHAREFAMSLGKSSSLAALRGSMQDDDEDQDEPKEGDK
ncbi:hypothetical protein NX059_004500 [Plenodomus lindquistii]|nr:hypothetical protein NX059_004500 [Plenodomus lindquistii]